MCRLDGSSLSFSKGQRDQTKAPFEDEVPISDFVNFVFASLGFPPVLSLSLFMLLLFECRGTGPGTSKNKRRSKRTLKLGGREVSVRCGVAGPNFSSTYRYGESFLLQILRFSFCMDPCHRPTYQPTNIPTDLPVIFPAASPAIPATRKRHADK